MGKIDPEKERKRLTELYAGMSDLELEKVGKNPEALTEWARSVLGEEFRKRGLEWKPEPRRSKPIAEDEILVRLREYSDRNSAGIDRDFLAAAGIKTLFYKQEGPSASQPGSPQGSKEVLLLVRSKDLASAQQQLMQKNDIQLPESRQPPTRPVVLRQYRDIPEAMVDKTALDSAGIECFLYDENMVRLDWFISNAIGGVKLVVGENAVEEAEKILAEAVRGNRGDVHEA